MDNGKDTELLDTFWQKHKGIVDAYHTASGNEDSVGIAQAKAEHRAWTAELEQMDKAFLRLYHWYEETKEVGNPHLDLHDVVWEKDVKELVDSFRRYGIERFTFSSGWSSAVETAWLFLQNGCRLEGMVELNSPHKDFDSGEYEKVHGYLFSVR